MYDSPISIETWNSKTTKMWHKTISVWNMFSYYFQDPGVSLPSSITTWVAIRGMPDYMANLRRACFELRTWKAKGQNKTRGLFSSAEPEYMKNEGKRRKKEEAKESSQSYERIKM